MTKEMIDLNNRKLKQHMLSLASPEAWEKTERLTEESIKPLVENGFLKGVRIVYLVGHGTSYATVRNGESYMAHIGKVYARAIPAYPFCQYPDEYLLNPAETLVIGVSCGGNTASVQRALKIANESGAKTLCITGETPGACMAEAQHTIITDAHIERQVDASAYSISHLFLLLAIYKLAIATGSVNGALTAQEAALWSERFEEVKAKLACLPALFDRMYEIYEGLEKIQKVQSIAVMGTGPNMGTATEGALKISEFAWMFCAAEELEDFAHGRFREMDKGTPMMLISPGKKTAAKTKDLLAGCDKSGTPVVVFTACADTAIRKLSTFVVDMPEVSDEYLTPFIYVFALWFYGYHHCVAEGRLVGDKRYDLYAVDVDFVGHFDEEGNRIRD